ncbi:hypothetical protein [Chitinibacter tainanensis]|uniref:hypothetical protein n=1 Tax=Chitinibacter tainanensis TaxID=230667 RepID=UPI00042381D2|nr:hypothetical protein [Chitinibacter tainanensis]
MSQEINQATSADLDALLQGLDESSVTAAAGENQIVSDAELDALIGSLEPTALSASDEREVEVEPEAEAVAASVSIEDEEAVINSIEAREKIYAEQESAAPDEEKASATPSEKASTRSRAAGKKASANEEAPKATAGKGRAAREVAATVELSAGEGPTETAAIIDQLAVKVKEKAKNLFAYLQDDVAISVYTKIALDKLVATGECDSSVIRSAMEAAGYKSGTINSQTGQIMQLFPAMKIAERSGRSGLRLLENSTIVAKYKKETA